MALPLVVIEQLARTLRNRETTIALQAMNAYTRIARRALLGVGQFTAVDAMEVYTSRVHDVFPLPFAEHTFSDDHSYVQFDSHRLAPNDGERTGQIEWMIVARGEGQDYVLAAQDQHLFNPGELLAPIDLAAYERETPVKYNNLILASNVGIYIVDSWADTAVILNGLFNPVSNEQFAIDVTVDIPAPAPEHMERTDAPLTMPGTDVHPNGVSILGGVQKTNGFMIDLPAELSEEQRGKVIEYVESLIAEASAPADEKAAAVDALVNRLYELYAADFRKLLGRIEGNVSDIKIRKAFKDYFVAKWNLNK